MKNCAVFEFIKPVELLEYLEEFEQFERAIQQGNEEENNVKKDS